MDKELDRLKHKAFKMLNKCDKKGYTVSDLDIAAIKNIANAQSMNDVNGLAFQHFVRLCQRLK
jgi:hypothetical protein